jgi:multiple RNA-binding domain-containing protein 1
LFRLKLGEVTDVKILKSLKGKSRGIVFFGFRHQEQANQAHTYFNNTCIGTSRINVEIAKKIGDDSQLENARSKYCKKKLSKVKSKNKDESFIS